MRCICDSWIRMFKCSRRRCCQIKSTWLKWWIWVKRDGSWDRSSRTYQMDWVWCFTIGSWWAWVGIVGINSITSWWTTRTWRIFLTHTTRRVSNHPWCSCWNWRTTRLSFNYTKPRRWRWPLKRLYVWTFVVLHHSAIQVCDTQEESLLLSQESHSQK